MDEAGMVRLERLRALAAARRAEFPDVAGPNDPEPERQAILDGHVALLSIRRRQSPQM